MNKFNQIVESYINGQRSQCFEQFIELDEIEKHDFLNWLPDNIYGIDQAELLTLILKRIY